MAFLAGKRPQVNSYLSKRFDMCGMVVRSSINICSIYLLAEHRRHQILPGLVRDGDIGFQRIVVFVTGKGHHDLGRHPLFKSMDDEGSSCSVHR